MAIYHASCRTVGRRAGRSSVAAAAYRAGCALIDERTGELHDFTKKSGVVFSEVIAPFNLVLSRADLWNAAECAENRKDGRTAREWIIALPHELNDAQRKEVALELSHWLIGRFGVAADLAIHQPARGSDIRNHHAHILLTTRKINEKGELIEKSDIELDGSKLKKLAMPSSKNQIIECRKAWEKIANTALAKYGHAECIDHRSHDDAGFDVMPSIKLGPAATEIERSGQLSERGDLNRARSLKNKSIKTVVDELKNLRIVEARAEDIKNTLFKLQSVIDKKPKNWMNPLVEVARNALLKAKVAFEKLVRWRNLENRIQIWRKENLTEVTLKISNDELFLLESKKDKLGDVDQLAEEKLKSAESNFNYVVGLAHEEWLSKNEKDKIKMQMLEQELFEINIFDYELDDEKENKDIVIQDKYAGNSRAEAMRQPPEWQPLRQARRARSSIVNSINRPFISSHINQKP